MKAAIDWIQKTVKQLGYMGSIRKPKWPGNKLSKFLRQALAVLEAGEKVDKSRALILLDSMHIPLRDDLAFKIKGQIRALLESLPDAKE